MSCSAALPSVWLSWRLPAWKMPHTKYLPLNPMRCGNSPLILVLSLRLLPASYNRGFAHHRARGAYQPSLLSVVFDIFFTSPTRGCNIVPCPSCCRFGDGGLYELECSWGKRSPMQRLSFYCSMHSGGFITTILFAIESWFNPRLSSNCFLKAFVCEE